MVISGENIRSLIFNMGCQETRNYAFSETGNTKLKWIHFLIGGLTWMEMDEFIGIFLKRE